MATSLRCHGMFSFKTVVVIYRYYLSFVNVTSFQHVFLGNCGNWSPCPRKERRGGGERWTGCSPLSTTWLNWFLQNKMVSMAAC